MATVIIIPVTRCMTVTVTTSTSTPTKKRLGGRRRRIRRRAGYTGQSVCVNSSGNYDSQKYYCYTCGGGSSDDDNALGYCWNSQTPQCPLDCSHVRGVGNKGDGNYGDPCDRFLSFEDVATRVICEAMGGGDSEVYPNGLRIWICRRVR